MAYGGKGRNQCHLQKLKQHGWAALKGFSKYFYSMLTVKYTKKCTIP